MAALAAAAATRGSTTLARKATVDMIGFPKQEKGIQTSPVFGSSFHELQKVETVFVNNYFLPIIDCIKKCITSNSQLHFDIKLISTRELGDSISCPS